MAASSWHLDRTRLASVPGVTKERDVDIDVLAEVRRLFAPEEDALTTARTRAPGNLEVPAPEVGTLLRWAATAFQARAAVEVGAAGGVSGLWLVPALGERGVLTSIEADPHAQGLATSAYADGGIASRVRAILSDPADVLPRLSDGAYDLFLLQGAPASFPVALAHARRLLRPGGVLIARGVLRPGEHANDLALFLEALATDEVMTASVLPIDDGLALALRGDDPLDGDA
jgi:predicted O-methyltransferase YrrM